MGASRRRQRSRTRPPHRAPPSRSGELAQSDHGGQAGSFRTCAASGRRTPGGGRRRPGPRDRFLPGVDGDAGSGQEGDGPDPRGRRGGRRDQAPGRCGPWDRRREPSRRVEPVVLAAVGGVRFPAMRASWRRACGWRRATSPCSASDSPHSGAPFGPLRGALLHGGEIDLWRAHNSAPPGA